MTACGLTPYFLYSFLQIFSQFRAILFDPEYKCFRSASMNRYEEIQANLAANPQTWLITGVAGFIGSNLLEALLKLDQKVVGLDNFSTGHRCNLDEVQTLVDPEQWSRFVFHEGDIRNLEDCKAACCGVSKVLTRQRWVLCRAQYRTQSTQMTPTLLDF